MADWNKAPDDIKRGYGPASREWAIRQLEANFPNRGGVPDRSREDAERIIDALLGSPHPFLQGFANEPDPGLTAWQAAEYARERGFLYREATTGWMDRTGKLFGCAYASHDALIERVFKLTTEDVYLQGWARINQRTWKCRFQLSSAQKLGIETLGLLVEKDGERLKPHWAPPESSAVEDETPGGHTPGGR